MQIERLEIEGFGNLANVTYEFAPDKLNLILEKNEFGKSTIAQAISAVLYDFRKDRSSEDKLNERERFRPRDGSVYRAALNLSFNGQKLRVVRDFDAKYVKVFDLNNGEKDVTADFMSGANNDILALKALGLSRDLFRATCFVGQQDLSSNKFAEDLELSSQLQRISDSSGAAGTSASAIAALQDVLHNFSYGTKSLKLERLVGELCSRISKLREELDVLEFERSLVSQDKENLIKLESDIQFKEKEIKATAYFDLCIRVAEIDNKLRRAQERLLRYKDLERQLSELNSIGSFPMDRVHDVEELHARYLSRKEDSQLAFEKLQKREDELRIKNLSLRERFEQVLEFTADDAQLVSGLAKTLKTANADLDDAEKKVEREKERVTKEGIDLSKVEVVRGSLLNLEAQDLDEAFSYESMISTARQQISTCERSVWRARAIVSEIQERRRAKKTERKNLIVLLGVIFAITTIVAIAYKFIAKVNNLDMVLTAASVIASIVGILTIAMGFRYVNSENIQEAELQTANQEMERETQFSSDLTLKVQGLETRLEDLARKAGVADGTELLKVMQSYASTLPKLKELDSLEQLLHSRRAQVVELISDIEPYFELCGWRTIEINPESAQELVDEINAYIHEKQALKTIGDAIDNERSQVTFLVDEVTHLKSQMEEVYKQARLDETSDIDLAYNEFLSKLEKFRHKESLEKELKQMEEDATSDLDVSELSNIIQKLEVEHKELWSGIKEIVDLFPDLEGVSPPTYYGKDVNVSVVEANLRKELDAMRKQKENLNVHVSLATKNYDERYLPMQEEYEGVDRELVSLKRTLSSLKLSKYLFEKISGETHEHWSSSLNEISKDLLQFLPADYESLSFDRELRLTVRKKDQLEPIQTASLNSQLSCGTREQMHLLARMAVVKFLSEKYALPLIFDEPFSEADDQRFNDLMRFLLEAITAEHQIIVFSCHEVRHNLFMDNLKDRDKGRVQMIKQKNSKMAKSKK